MEEDDGDEVEFSEEGHVLAHSKRSYQATPTGDTPDDYDHVVRAPQAVQ